MVSDMTAALAVGFGLGYLIAGVDAGVVGMLLAGTAGLIAEVSQM